MPRRNKLIRKPGLKHDGFRLDKGGLIERRQKINFRFNGTCNGVVDTPLHLMVSGHALVGRSLSITVRVALCLLR